MKQHSHKLVEQCDDALGIGLDRETDEKTIICYLQKFADDTLLQTLVKRLSDQEIDDIAHFIFKTLKNHLTEAEYHSLFLKDKES
jgi:TorA maturation chaperone TorD